MTLRSRIASLRKKPAAVPEAPATPLVRALLASPLNHPVLVEDARARLGAHQDDALPVPLPRLSWFFDPAFYLAANPDVAEAGMEPYVHFLAHGIAEGRSPHPLVDLGWLAPRKASAEAPWTAQELALVLRDNARDPHPLFKVAHYLDSNPDVREAAWSAFEHFLAHGAEEGRAPNPDFHADDYLAKHPDLPRSRLAAFIAFARPAVAPPAADVIADPAPAEASTAPDAPDAPPAAHPDGRLDQILDQVAYGWAWVPGQPGTPVEVELVAEGRVVGAGVANHFRADLETGGIGNGHHAFQVPVSRTLLDGQLHVVSARVRGHPAARLPGTHVLQQPRTDRDVLDAIPVEVARDALAALGAEPAFIQRAADAFLVLEASGAADATAAIEALASERGEWGIVLAKQAELRLVAGEPDAALALYERAGELGGVPPGWLALGRGTTLRRLGRNEEALASYQEGLGHAPGLVRLQVRIRELTLHDRLAECAALVADNRPAAALPMLGDLLVHVPGDASVQAQALQVQRAISGLSTGDMAPALADAHRELDLFETVLQHLERDRAPS